MTKSTPAPKGGGSRGGRTTRTTTRIRPGTKTGNPALDTPDTVETVIIEK